MYLELYTPLTKARTDRQTGLQRYLMQQQQKIKCTFFQFAVFFRHLVDEYNWKHVMFMYQYYPAQSGKVQFCLQSVLFVHSFTLV